MSQIKRILFVPHSVEPARELEAVIYWVRSLRAYLFVLLHLDDHLCHYGEIDPLASTKSREEFVRYVRAEALAEIRNVQKELHEQLLTHRVLYQFICEHGPFLETILKTLKDYPVEIAIFPKRLLGTGLRKKLLYQSPTDLLFV